LREIERVELNIEIDCRQTSPERKAEAIAQRDAALIEWSEIMTELEDLGIPMQLPHWVYSTARVNANAGLGARSAVPELVHYIRGTRRRVQ
jgi:hypothetical protein